MSGPEVPSPSDPIFGKSKSNVASELSAMTLLLSDKRFQQPDVATKKAILSRLPAPSDVSHRTFDAVMTQQHAELITQWNVERYIDGLHLIELKATKKSIQNASLNGFFFGATKREYDLAAALGDRYRFAFVVLSSDNEYGRPFFVLMTLEDLERRTKTKRIQYQVNLRSDMDPGASEAFFGGEIIEPEGPTA